MVRHTKRVRLADRLIEGQEDWLTKMQKKIIENTAVLVERQIYKKNTYTQYDRLTNRQKSRFIDKQNIHRKIALIQID